MAFIVNPDGTVDEIVTTRRELQNLRDELAKINMDINDCNQSISVAQARKAELLIRRADLKALIV